MRVGISHDFFRKGLNDYAEPAVGWIREVCQNSLDSGADNVRFTTGYDDGGNTVVTVENDGPPMDEDTLLNKFLCLGGTTKTFDGTVGGFGVAKVIIALAHKSYRIDTGICVVEGSGGDFELSARPHFHGTRTKVVFFGDCTAELKRAFDNFCKFGQWGGTLWWNGSPSKMNMKKGSPRRELSFGTVYTNKSDSNKLVVRMGGIPMFVQYVGIDRCVVVELSGKSSDVLTSNRDGLRYSYRNELSDFITEITVDKRSALKPKKSKYRHYDGSRLCHQKSRKISVSDLVSTSAKSVELPEVVEAVDWASGGDSFSVGSDDFENIAPVLNHTPNTVAEFERAQIRIDDEFVIKNNTDLVVPTYYRPDEPDFSSYSRKLAKIWGRLLLQLHRTFDVESSFAIGFVFDDDRMSEFEDGQFGSVYYIAPAKLVQQQSSQSRSWRNCWKLTDRNQLLLTALHEFIHGSGGNLRYHDEDYSSKLTDWAAKVMDHKKDFTWCYGQ